MWFHVISQIYWKNTLIVLYKCAIYIGRASINLKYNDDMKLVAG